MRIAQISHLYERVPPMTYGGVERVVSDLTEELVKRGHEVVLFARSDSCTSATLVPVTLTNGTNTDVDKVPMYMLFSLREALRRSDHFDVVHSHLSEWGVLFHDLFPIPFVTTLHNPIYIKEFCDIHRLTKSAPRVSVSNSQRTPLPELNYLATVYNGIILDAFPFSEQSGDYLAFLGRVSHLKGTHLAIELAKRAGERLIIAGKVDQLDVLFYEQYVKPKIDGDQIQYIGEVSAEEKGEFLKGAKALVGLVQWEEPFGLFLVEAMATGTPIIAWNKGAISEVVQNGVTGFIVQSMEEAVEATKKIGQIARRNCREHVRKNFTVERMADGYEAVYKKMLDR